MSLVALSILVISSLRTGAADMCADTDYTKTTLKLADEETFMSLMKINKGQKKFEASDVVSVNDQYYAVCDSSWSIEKIGNAVTPFSSENVQIGDPNRIADVDSGYEGLFYDYNKENFVLVRESVSINSPSSARASSQYHALFEEVTISADGTDYSLNQICMSEIAFDGDSKGFEGIVGLRSADGELYALGLCEGNFCKEGSSGKTKGNGYAVLMKKEENSASGFGEYTCVWKTVRILKIPSTAYFQDYSSISINSAGRVAITSQEESQVWIGQMTYWTSPSGNSTEGTFDPTLSEFDATTGNAVVYDFPRDTECEVIYCNIEGIHFMKDNDNMLIAVSDQTKKDGAQDYRCVEKDQSIHFFAMP